MILIADTSGIIAASDRNAPEASACQTWLQDAGTVIVSPLVLDEVDHLARARFGAAARTAILTSLLTHVRRMRFQIPDMSPDVFEAALSVQGKYAELALDLADAVNVVLAAEYRTDAMLTLDHRDFRVIRPLTPHSAFRLLPDGCATHLEGFG